MLNIVCFKWGDLFGPEYVNKLYNSIKRNTTIPINFICYTEDPTGVECETREFLEPLPYWWYIIGLFNPAHGFKNKTIYLDLDTVITGNIDHILTLEEDFATLRDFYRPNGLQTAYIMWEPEWGAFIWDRLKTQYPKPGHYKRLLKFAGGTNRFLEQSVGLGNEVVRLQDKFNGECVSYKVNIRRPERFVPDREKIVFFHGQPRPHEVAHLPFMRQHWI